jgi:hypothetical protein
MLGRTLQGFAHARLASDHGPDSGHCLLSGLSNPSASQSYRVQAQRHRVMFKLIGIILAAIPVVLFLRAIFTGQSKKRSQAVSDFKKQVDYLVWAMLFLIGCGFVYSIGKLILD